MKTEAIGRTDEKYSDAFKGVKDVSSNCDFFECFFGSSDYNRSLIEKLVSDNDDINIFEHYASYDEDNMKFLLSDISVLIPEISKFISKEIASFDNDANSFLSSINKYFGRLFDKIDSIYGTKLSDSFQKFSEDMKILISSETENSIELKKFSKNDIIQEFAKVFDTMKENMKFQENNYSNMNFGDKFNISYLLEKLSKINDYIKLSGTNMPELSSVNLQEQIQIRHLIIKGDSNKEKVSDNGKLPAISITEESEVVYNNRQNGDFFDNNDDFSSKLANKNINVNNIIGKEAKLFTFADNLAEQSQVQSNHTFRSVRLFETGRIISGFIRQLPQNSDASAKLILEPATLGMIIVDLKMKGNIANLTIKVNNRETFAAVENQISLLKERMQKQGIETENIDIVYSEKEKEGYQTAGNYQGKNQAKEKREFLDSFRNINNGDEDVAEKQEKMKFFTGKIIEKYV